MTLSPSIRTFLTLGASACLFAQSYAAAAKSAASADSTALPPVSLQDLDYSGDQSALAALDKDLNAAGTDAAKLAALETRLVDLLKRTDSSIAARQAAAQRLGFVFALNGAPSTGALKLLQTMLVDDREADLARLTLEPVAGDVIDQAFISALATTTGRTRIGIIQSLAKRAPASAISSLEKLLNDTDGATASAAAIALGQIGGPAALGALKTAAVATPAVIEAKFAAARKLPATEAAALFTAMQRDTKLASHQRATALRGLLNLDPASAATRIAEVLTSTDWTLKQAALESLFASRATGLIPALAGKLSTWDAPTQSAVIAVIERRADATALPALLVAAKHQDAAVRAAAVSALGRMPGTGELVTLLAGIAAGANVDDAKLAKQSLARLNGPGVSAAVLAGAEKGESSLRAAHIEQIALRGLTEGLPLLRQCRTATDTTIRAAAIGALGDLAPASDQPLVIAWLSGATDSNEQTRGLRALLNLTLRMPDTTARVQPIYTALEQADAITAVRLLPILPRLGGIKSAECAARLAVKSDAALADAATSTLARWPDRTALASLVLVSAKGTAPSARSAASQAALRYFERNRELWTKEQTALVAQLLDSTKDAAARKRLVVLLNRASDKDALALAEKLQAETALATEAKEAALCIAASLAGSPKAKASANDGSLRNLFDGKPTTRWSIPAAADQWLEIDFAQARPLHRLTLDQSGKPDDFPEHYEIFVTRDPQHPGTAVAKGTGQRNKTVVELPAGTSGRYVIIKHSVARADSSWTISDLYVD
jgi:hypothetical protein